MRRHLIHWIVGLSLTGVGLSTYAFLHKTGFVSGAICNLNDTFSCDTVNQGPYSDIASIPVALIGIFGYAFVFIAALLKRRTLEDRGLSLFLLVASVGGFLFALYLTGLEAFVLYAWCIVCLLSQALVTALLALSFTLYRHETHL